MEKLRERELDRGIEKRCVGELEKEIKIENIFLFICNIYIYIERERERAAPVALTVDLLKVKALVDDPALTSCCLEASPADPQLAMDYPHQVQWEDKDIGKVDLPSALSKLVNCMCRHGNQHQVLGILYTAIFRLE